MSNWSSAAVENMNLQFPADTFFEVVVLVSQKVTGYMWFGRRFNVCEVLCFASWPKVLCVTSTFKLILWCNLGVLSWLWTYCMKRSGYSHTVVIFSALICRNFNWCCFHVPEQAVIFVDNSGSDVVLGILPFARELLRRGTKVCYLPQYIPWRISSSYSTFLVRATLPNYTSRMQSLCWWLDNYDSYELENTSFGSCFCTNMQSQLLDDGYLRYAECSLRISCPVLFHSLLSLQVVLTANDMPSINDITYEELVQVISTVRL